MAAAVTGAVSTGWAKRSTFDPQFGQKELLSSNWAPQLVQNILSILHILDILK
jgi:hypothetical protein